MRLNRTLVTTTLLALVSLATAAACGQDQDRRGVVDRAQTVTVGEPVKGSGCIPTMVDTTAPEIAAAYDQALARDAVRWTGPANTRYEQQNGTKVKITSIAFEVGDPGAPTETIDTLEPFAAGTLTCTSHCEAGGQCTLKGCDPKADKSGCTECSCSHKDDEDCEDEGCFCEKQVTAGVAALE